MNLPFWLFEFLMYTPLNIDEDGQWIYNINWTGSYFTQFTDYFFRVKFIVFAIYIKFALWISEIANYYANPGTTGVDLYI